jgi:hypothetical protein
MKKCLFTLFILCSVSTISFSQQGFSLGLKLGANLTKIDGVKFREAFNTAYQAGAFAELNFDEKWGIQPELLFSQTKTKQDTSLGQVVRFQNTGDIKLDYLTIPVLLRYNVSRSFTLNVGPQFGILLNKNDNLLTNGQNAFKGGDFSLVAGAQINLSSLRIYGRYNIGLTDINDVGNSDRWRHQQIQLGLGLKLL